MSKVLVVYATKYGSTGEVAEKIGDNIRNQGSEVDVMSVEDVKSLETYDNIVFGAALYAGNIAKPARTFLERNRDALEQKPVAIFILGPISREEKEMTDAYAQMDKVLAKYEWFKPVSKQVFVGKFDPTMLKFPWSLALKLPASPLYEMAERDERDWDAIGSWAATVA